MLQADHSNQFATVPHVTRCWASQTAYHVGMRLAWSVAGSIKIKEFVDVRHCQSVSDLDLIDQQHLSRNLSCGVWKNLMLNPDLKKPQKRKQVTNSAKQLIHWHKY